MVKAHRHVIWASVLLATGMLTGCGTKPADADRTKADTRFDENKSLFAAIRDVGPVVLYEGLPHPFHNPQQVEEEKRQKQTLLLHGFLFYAAPLEVGAEDAAKLRELLADERSFHQWRGEKKCGGFHPDYLAEYRVGESAYRFLICFGCHEIMVFGPEGSLRCDFQDDAYKQLKALLKNYSKNRPASGER